MVEKNLPQIEEEKLWCWWIIDDSHFPKGWRMYSKEIYCPSCKQVVEHWVLNSGVVCLICRHSRPTPTEPEQTDPWGKDETSETS
jgi:hypothetical protein